MDVKEKKKQQLDEAANLFDEWLKTIAVKDYISIRGRIKKDCFINSDTVIFNWRKGITPIPYRNYEAINLIAGKKLLQIPNNNIL